MSEKPIFPLLYAGPLSYYAALIHYGEFAFDQCEHYPKQTLRNRCVIYGANGALNLSIPIERKGERTKVVDVTISNAERWQHLHWRSFEAAYRSSPYFEFFEDDLKPLYQNPKESLFDFNMEVHQLISKWLNLELSFDFTTSFLKDNPAGTEYRALFSKGASPFLDPAPYYQVFGEKHGFLKDLSIFDLLFNLGMEAGPYLKNLSKGISA